MHAPSFKHTTPDYRTFCGPRALESLRREFERVGCSRVVLVHGQSMHRYPDALDRLRDVIGSRLVGAFDRVEEHSPLPSVEAARNLLSDLGADAVIAVGGGSPIVTARAATILLAEGRSASELATHRDLSGRLVSPRLKAPKLPQWVVPTTPTTAYAKAGSAVMCPESGDRLALFDPKTRAQGVFMDPQFALTAPNPLVKASALNAFSMAVEGLQADVGDPLADALLTAAVRDLARWIPQFLAAPSEPEPRLRLMVAALLSGQGTDYTGGGLAQALSHAAGPRSVSANGIVEAICLPFSMEFNASVTEGGLRAVAVALGAERNDGKDLSRAALPAVAELLRLAGVPARLRDVGIARETLPDIGEHALDDWALATVPRPPSRDELGSLLAAAW